MLYTLLTNFMTEYRGVFVTVFVLPFSLLFDVALNARQRIVMRIFSAPLLHRKRVEYVKEQILKWSGEGKLCTARGGWQSITLGDRTYKAKGNQIAVNLMDILELNEKEMYVHVEPLVSMGQLSHFLIEKNYTIPVLPELDDLTVGGLYMGVGIETSSHKYGLFNDSVIEAEVILSDGRVLTCSLKENKDLFEALPWSYGTLGFLLSVKIKVVPCKPYVRIEYIPCRTREEGIRRFRELSVMESPPDFVESLMYSSETSVVMPSNFVDEPKDPKERAKINVISRWYKPWFFKHVESFLSSSSSTSSSSSSSSSPLVEYIPIRDYYHRHTKSIFWELEDIIPFGNNPVYRFFLGWAIPPKVSFLKITQTPQIKKLYETSHVVQDMLVPIDKTSEALDVFHAKFEIYPLWLCPYRAYAYDLHHNSPKHLGFLRRPQNLLPGKDYEMYVDLGVYGTPRAVKEKRPGYDAIEMAKEVEQYVLSVRGFQMLYATSYLTREDFRKMFNHDHYDEMKRKYDGKNAFPQIFDKTCKAGLANWIKADKIEAGKTQRVEISKV